MSPDAPPRTGPAAPPPRIPIPRAFALVRRFWPVMRPHLRYVWILTVFTVLSTPLAVLSPRIVMKIVDAASRGAGRENIPRWTLVLIGMAVLSVAFGIATGASSALFKIKVLRTVRLRLYTHMQSLSLRYFRDKETGWLMSRQTDDVNNLGGVTADVFVRAAVDLLQAGLFLAMLFLLEWRMALGGLVIVAVVLGVQLALSKPLRARSRSAQESWTRLSEVLHQAISGQPLIQATASERRETQRFAGALHAGVRASMRREMFGLFANHLMFLITGVAPTLIILMGAYLIARNEFTVGALFAFFMYLVQMFGSISEVARLNPAFQSSAASLQRIFEVLDTVPEIRSPEAGARPARLLGEVCFESVSFAYDPGRPVLEGIDLAVAPDTTVALVGPSGAGKTTLAGLIPRFFDPSSGRVLVDGTDLRDYDLRRYRRQVGIVPQDVFLFDRTVAENIAIGAAGSGLESIRAAARAANALEFIEELPKGFDTVIGERGLKLSGGQRQRIAIAREILRDPRILILDEATSSLDSRSEALIQEALVRLFENRTSFVIAHRLSTVLRSDEIVVLDRGRIVERGPHRTLVQAGGLYAQLYAAQFAAHAAVSGSEGAP